MAELPLSKFAPFCKYEAHYKTEVSNKLKDLNIKCSGCIYYDKDNSKTVPGPHVLSDPREPVAMDEYSYEYQPGTELYHCHILKKRESYVAPDAICRFFTPIEEVVEKSPNQEEEEADEELSLAIQKLDFTNSNITDSINQLRETLTNGPKQ